jgi:hypothetical protein
MDMFSRDVGESLASLGQLCRSSVHVFRRVVEDLKLAGQVGVGQVDGQGSQAETADGCVVRLPGVVTGFVCGAEPSGSRSTTCVAPVESVPGRLMDGAGEAAEGCGPARSKMLSEGGQKK